MMIKTIELTWRHFGLPAMGGHLSLRTPSEDWPYRWRAHRTTALGRHRMAMFGRDLVLRPIECTATRSRCLLVLPYASIASPPARSICCAKCISMSGGLPLHVSCFAELTFLVSAQTAVGFTHSVRIFMAHDAESAYLLAPGASC